MAGDKALQAMLLFHGAVMNGGVLDALEAFDATGLSAATKGHRYFGLGSVADFLVKSRLSMSSEQDLDEFEAQLDADYSVLVPDDRTLEQKFKRALESRPGDFAPAV
jgi:hypothetical protein